MFVGITIWPSGDIVSPPTICVFMTIHCPPPPYAGAGVDPFAFTILFTSFARFGVGLWVEVLLAAGVV